MNVCYLLVFSLRRILNANNILCNQKQITHSQSETETV